MKKLPPIWLCKLLSIMSAFILGSFCTQEFKFNQPVELYKYAFTFIFGYLFYILGERKE